MKCTHTDCATCPYPDCISATGPANEAKKKPGRKKLPKAIIQQHRRAYSRQYYLEHKEEFSAYYKEYNKKNAEKNRERQRAWRDARRGYSLKDPTVWITKDSVNKRVPFSKLSEYEANGWNRGRSL